MPRRACIPFASRRRRESPTSCCSRSARFPRSRRKNRSPIRRRIATTPSRPRNRCAPRRWWSTARCAVRSAMSTASPARRASGASSKWRRGAAARRSIRCCAFWMARASNWRAATTAPEPASMRASISRSPPKATTTWKSPTRASARRCRTSTASKWARTAMPTASSRWAAGAASRREVTFFGGRMRARARTPPWTCAMQAPPRRLPASRCPTLPRCRSFSRSAICRSCWSRWRARCPSRAWSTAAWRRTAKSIAIA